MSEELAVGLSEKHRPTLFKQVIGQDDAIATLQNLINRGFPKPVLAIGNSGCGKTTLLRICATKIGCLPRDLKEINAAESRGIDTIREIKDRMRKAILKPGKCRVYLIDEAHKLTNEAQNAMLKTIEEPPPRVKFMLASTEPNKLLKTIITRCAEVRVNAVSQNDLLTILNTVAGKEGVSITDAVANRIAEVAEGSPRKALVLLEQVIGIDSEDQQLDIIQKSEGRQQGIQLARVLVNPRAQWAEVGKVLRELDEEPERLRHMVLGYCNAILLKGGPLAARANFIIGVFRDHLYDCGRPGLSHLCYTVVNATARK